MAEKTIPTNENKKELVKREVTRTPEAYVSPLTDIYETAESLNVMVDLPGVNKDGLKVTVENGILTIEGKVDASKKEYLFREFEPSNYFRQFEITDKINQEKISAELKNGVLNLSLPKAEEMKPRSIEIQYH